MFVRNSPGKGRFRIHFSERRKWNGSERVWNCSEMSSREFK